MKAPTRFRVFEKRIIGPSTREKSNHALPCRGCAGGGITSQNIQAHVHNIALPYTQIKFTEKFISEISSEQHWSYELKAPKRLRVFRNREKLFTEEEKQNKITLKCGEIIRHNIRARPHPL
jgi:hypothetical protein